MKILLVEPDYKNKFPPIGLMKIAQYHKSKRDRTDFVKGCYIINDIFYDRIYITSLFTFETKRTIDTVSFYAQEFPAAEIFLGGISATILEKYYAKHIPEKVKLIVGQITDSGMIGMEDNTNIDSLIPDYDILDDIDYKYKESDSYFIHFSRGCVRSCAFCAVKILEPNFKSIDYVETIINETKEKYGIKKYLRVMDNNILYLNNFNEVIEILKRLGYAKFDEKVKRDKEIELAYKSLDRRVTADQNCKPAMNRIKKVIDSIDIKITDGKYKNMKKHFKDFYDIKSLIEKYENDLHFFLNYKEVIVRLVNKITGNSYVKLVVDMNQGIDARGIVKFPYKAKGLSEINLDPCRIAFDSIKEKDIYIKAILICHSYGIDRFSNYLLFNYLDTPEDLYERMRINLDLSIEKALRTQFSFPMKYAPIYETDRSFVGKNWSKLQLDGYYAMLNATKGVVVNDLSFFEKAYGKNKEEFNKLLHMPYEYIKNRKVNEENGNIEKWNIEFSEFREQDIFDLKQAYINGWKSSNSRVLNIKRHYVKVV